MNGLDWWIDLWTWVFAAAIGSFYVLVLVVAPLGFRDILRLFANLNEKRSESRRCGSVARGRSDSGGSND